MLNNNNNNLYCNKGRDMNDSFICLAENKHKIKIETNFIIVILTYKRTDMM